MQCMLIESRMFGRKAPLLAEYYQIMSSLDYNYHQMMIQFTALDDLTDITATVSWKSPFIISLLS